MAGLMSVAETDVKIKLLLFVVARVVKTASQESGLLGMPPRLGAGGVASTSSTDLHSQGGGGGHGNKGGGGAGAMMGGKHRRGHSWGKSR